MTDTQTIEAIHRHLDECPTDWTARLQLADLYEDAMLYDEARFQRWLVRYGKSPARDAWTDEMESRWFWWRNAPRFRGASVGRIASRLAGYGIGRRARHIAEAELMEALVDCNWPDPPPEVA